MNISRHSRQHRQLLAVVESGRDHGVDGHKNRGYQSGVQTATYHCMLTTDSAVLPGHRLHLRPEMFELFPECLHDLSVIGDDDVLFIVFGR